MSSLQPKTRNLDVTSFSPHFKSSVRLVTQGDEVAKLSPEQTSLNHQELNLQSIPDMDIVHTETDNNFNMSGTNTRSSTRLSTRRVPEPDTAPLIVAKLQSLSDNRVADQEVSNLKPSSPANHKTVTESTDSSVDKFVLKNIKTYLYWAEVRREQLKSQETKEDICDQTKLGLPDKMKSPFLSRTSSPAYRRKNDVNIQQNTESLKSTTTGSIKAGDDVVAALKDTKTSDVDHFHVVIPLYVTSFCFVGEHDILIGTSSRQLLISSLPSFHPIYALGQNGPKLVDDVTETFLNESPSPHKEAIIYITTSEDLKVLISCDPGMVCLWDAQNRNLTMKIELPMDQKISHVAVSKDAIVVAMVTNSRTIRLWSPVERREIASYRTMFDIFDFQMTCDCRKVIVRGTSLEKKDTLEIFDILNVDDILIHVASRKENQQQLHREHLANERKKNRHHNEAWRMSSSLNVIKEGEQL